MILLSLVCGNKVTNLLRKSKLNAGNLDVSSKKRVVLGELTG
jgi:hypothetical protein